MKTQILNKYKAKTTEYNGRIYQSKLEAAVARDLHKRKLAGEFVEIVPQFRIKLYAYLADGTKSDLFSYICDFRCEKPDGTFLLVEAKGKKTDVYKLKHKVLHTVWLPDHLNYKFTEIFRSRK